MNALSIGRWKGLVEGVNKPDDGTGWATLCTISVSAIPPELPEVSAAGAAPEALDDKSRAPALDVPLSDIVSVRTAMRSHQLMRLITCVLV